MRELIRLLCNDPETNELAAVHASTAVLSGPPTRQNGSWGPFCKITMPLVDVLAPRTKVATAIRALTKGRRVTSIWA
ncbi:MAG: hypothetical protein NUW23_16105, partial [Firmicutes bacterium]|nr:hypothetical protein [Bacillota bacterium]